MLSHLSIGVSSLEDSGDFYDAVLAPLGCGRVWTSRSGIGYGPPGAQDKLAIFAQAPPIVRSSPGFHLAFAAVTRADVDLFHAAALAHGGADAGAPGLRPRYGAGYYAAFVRDPDGHKLEAVCHENGASVS